MPIDWGNKPTQPRAIPVQPAPMQQPVQQPSQYVQQPVQYEQQPIQQHQPLVHQEKMMLARDAGVTAAKRAIWPWVVAFMSLFFMLFIVVVLVVAFLYWPDSDADRETPEKPLSGFVLSTIPAVRASQEENLGRAEVYREVASKIDSGEIDSMEGFAGFIKTATETVKNKSFEPLIKTMQNFNGDRWDGPAMSKLAKEYADGFQRAAGSN